MHFENNFVMNCFDVSYRLLDLPTIYGYVLVDIFYCRLKFFDHFQAIHPESQEDVNVARSHLQINVDNAASNDDANSNVIDGNANNVSSSNQAQETANSSVVIINQNTVQCFVSPELKQTTGDQCRLYYQ